MSSSRKLLGQSPPTQPKPKSTPLFRKRTEPVLQSSALRSDSQGKRCHPLRSFSDSHLQHTHAQSPHLKSESESEPVIQSSPLQSDSQGKGCHPLGSLSDSHLCNSVQKAKRNLLSNLHHWTRTAKGSAVIPSACSGDSTPTQPQTKSCTSAEQVNWTSLARIQGSRRERMIHCRSGLLRFTQLRRHQDNPSEGRAPGVHLHPALPANAS